MKTMNSSTGREMCVVRGYHLGPSPRNIPFNHLALRYTLANIGQLEPLKNFAGRPPRWRRMKVCDMSPPAERASRLA